MQRVLIIDDEPHILKLLELKFQLEGFTVLSAKSGEEGLELARAHPPDLVILDVMMPGVDGFTVAESLKANPATENAPIIFLSARTSDHDEAHGLEVGAVAYVRKPFRPSQLLALAREVL